MQGQLVLVYQFVWIIIYPQVQITSAAVPALGARQRVINTFKIKMRYLLDFKLRTFFIEGFFGLLLFLY